MAECQLVPQAVRRMRLTLRNCCGERFKPPKCAVASSTDRPAAHGVAQRLGLLEDLLEHEMVIAAQIDVARLQFERLHAVMDFALVAMDDAQRVGRNNRNLMLGQINDLVGVADQRRSVAGDEVFVFAHAHHQRAAVPGSNDHVGIVVENDRQAIGALQLGQSTANGREQWFVRGRRIVRFRCGRDVQVPWPGNPPPGAR